jgi:hypothetical protein
LVAAEPRYVEVVTLLSASVEEVGRPALLRTQDWVAESGVCNWVRRPWLSRV